MLRFPDCGAELVLPTGRPTHWQPSRAGLLTIQSGVAVQLVDGRNQSAYKPPL